MHHLIWAAVLVALISTPLIIVTPSPAAACVSLPAPFDSFSTAVPDAGTIVVGTVEGLAERETHTRFRLNIDEVLRGKAPAAMRFSGLSGSDARSACGDRNAVAAREGDRLGLAMSAAVPGQPLKVDAVAFVGKSKPDRRYMPKVERLPSWKVRQLAGQAPDGSTARRPYDAGIAADDLITQRVAPGVARVSELGTKHDLKAIRQLDVSDQDRVWAATREATYQLGQRKEYRARDELPRTVGNITTGHDGAAAVDGWRGVSLFEEDEGWTRISRKGGRNALHSPFLAPDGTVLAHSMLGVSQFDGEWTLFGWDEIGPPAVCVDRFHPLAQSDCSPTSMVKAPDGSVWVGFHTDLGIVPNGGLRRFDGEAWTDVPDPLDGEPFAVTHLAAYPGGPVWALIVPRGFPSPRRDAYRRAQLARWDGESWTRFNLPADLRKGRRSQPRDLVAGPDGVVWLTRPLASFDGETWRQYDTPGRAPSKWPRVQDLSIAPDGSAWMVVHDNRKFHTTRPDGIYILDPARAKPAEVTNSVAPKTGTFPAAGRSKDRGSQRPRMRWMTPLSEGALPRHTSHAP